jgi:hypothetical protein
MKPIVFLITLVLSLTVESNAQKPTLNPARLTDAAPCVSRQSPKRTKRPLMQQVGPAPVEPGAEFFVGEAVVEVTKDQTVVRLAMAQRASVLIELPANDGPRYIIPGDPEMVTVDEKALERNKRAIIVRPGSLFVVPAHNQKRLAPAATVTAQMRSGLVVTFLFYPVADLARNVHRCVLNYQRDEVVARRRAAGLPVNLDQKEQGGEKPTGQSGAPASISVEPADGAKATDVDAFRKSGVSPSIESPSKVPEVRAIATQVPNGTSDSLTSEPTNVNERFVSAAKKQLALATAEPGTFKNWTTPLHGVSLAVRHDDALNEDFRVLLLAVKNAGARPLKLIPGTPELTLEMHDDKGKVINVQSIKPLHIEVSDTSREVAVGGTTYYAIAYTPPVMGLRQWLKILVAQANAAEEPASIALLK